MACTWPAAPDACGRRRRHHRGSASGISSLAYDAGRGLGVHCVHVERAPARSGRRAPRQEGHGWENKSTPSRNAISVGIDMIPRRRRVRSRSRCRPWRTRCPGVLDGGGIEDQGNMRHGPHHDAHQSTSTMLFSAMVDSNVAADSATVPMGHPPGSGISTGQPTYPLGYSASRRNIPPRASVGWREGPQPQEVGHVLPPVPARVPVAVQLPDRRRDDRSRGGGRSAT